MKKPLRPLLLILLVSGCAVTGGWRQVREVDAVALYYQAHPGSAIPEFRATVVIQGSRSSVLSVMTDFAAWPEWVYRCERAEIVATRGYEEAWLYQVTDMPLVRDRDMLMHASIHAGDDEVVIDVESAPDYCDNNARTACQRPNRSGLVRVTDLSGSFRIRSLGRGRVEVTWQQYLDPNGWIPDWITRLALSDVPVHSLQRLKQIVEQEE